VLEQAEVDSSLSVPRVKEQRLGVEFNGRFDVVNVAVEFSKIVEGVGVVGLYF